MKKVSTLIVLLAVVGFGLGISAWAQSPSQMRDAHKRKKGEKPGLAQKIQRAKQMQLQKVDPIPQGNTSMSVLGPQNDECANAIDIFDGPTPFSTVGASTDGAGSPTCNFFGNNQIAQDIWFNYQATCSGTISINTCGSSFDTKLAIYDGLDCPSGEPLACNDDSCAVQSQISAAVTEGSLYKIRVGGYQAATGTGTITITCGGGGGGDNDLCANSVEIFEGATAFSTVGATTDGPPSPDCTFFGDAQVNQDIWYHYQATCTGNLNVSLCGSGFDTKLAVYDGNSCVGQLLACNDDSCALQSEVNVPTIAGNFYKIRIGGYLDDTGSGTVSLSCGKVSGNDFCAGAVDIFEGSTEFSNVGTNTDGPALPGECDEGFGVDFGSDIWFRYTATCTGNVSFSTCGTASYDTRLALYEECVCPVNNTRLVACNDDGPGCPDFSSNLVAFVKAGTCYMLRVGGYAGEQGTGSLNIQCEAVPKACVAGVGDCFEGHEGPGCEDPQCCADVCAQDPFCCDVAWDDSCAGIAEPLCGVPPNDNCQDAPIETLPHTYIGSNHNSTQDCALFSPPPGHAWVAFEISKASSVTLDYCGTDPAFQNGWLNLAVGCPCADFTEAATFNLFQCGDGNVTLNWACLPAGVYYYPILTEPGSDGPYTINVSAQECGGGSLDNDACANATEIQLGDTPFSNIGATMDGVNLPAQCEEGFGLVLGADLWYEFTAPFSGDLTVSLCGSASYDSRLALYQGCNCPASNASLVGCDDDGCGDLGGPSSLTAPVSAGQCYLLRVGGFGNAQGTGVLNLEIGGGSDCPSGSMSLINPPNGVIDARQNLHPSGGANQGIQQVLVSAPAGASQACFSFCETSNAGQAPNSISSVIDHGDGTYTLAFARPITAGAVSTVRYLADGSFGSMIFHPANASGDTSANPIDILRLIDFLNGVQAPPWGIYSLDTDRSGVSNPADILRLIDLLNGAGALDPWNQTPLPVNPGICP